MIELLPRERNVLLVIRQTWEAYHEVPTVMEIVRQTEKSYMYVYRTLVVLRNLGFIDMRSLAGAVIIEPLYWE